jgi:hypothetical protein
MIAKHGIILLVSIGLCLAAAAGQTAQSALPPGSAALISPDELAKLLQAKGEKPLILSVGPSLLFMQAHIPGAEYIGAGSNPQGFGLPAKPR